MQTDYSTLTQLDFEKEVKKYLVFKILNDDLLEDSADEEAE